MSDSILPTVWKPQITKKRPRPTLPLLQAIWFSERGGVEQVLEETRGG